MSVNIRNLDISINGNSIVHDVQLTIADGERVGLIGSSGSGKSMIAKAMMGILPSMAQVSGDIDLDGTHVVGATDEVMATLRGRSVGMVFQNPSVALNPVMTVAQQVGLPLYLHYDLTLEERAERVKTMLSKVGLAEDALLKYPHELSGGQQQRVGIARAFAAMPKVVFADEPTGNLDTKTTTEVMEMVCGFARSMNQTIVLVTHDPSMAAYADRIVTLIDGQVVDDTRHPAEAPPPPQAASA